VDSHYDLPVINKSRAELDSMELKPFKALIAAGIGSVMVAHLSVPSIDNTPKFATSLSPKAVNDLLRKELGFKGISVTDAIDMKAIANYFPQGESSAQALIAGNDMLCLPGDIDKSLTKVRQAIRDRKLRRRDIKEKVKKVLNAKYEYGLSNLKVIDTANLLADLNQSVGVIKEAMATQSLTYCKSNTLPDLLSRKKTAYVALNAGFPTILTKGLAEQYGVDIFYIAAKDSSKLASIKNNLVGYEQVIIGLHNYSKRPANKFEIPNAFIQFLNESHPNNWMHVVLGNPYAVGHFSRIQNILFAYEDNIYTHKAVLSWLEGKIQATGELPVTVSEDLPFGSSYKNTVTINNHIENEKLTKIDSLVQDAITKKAIPGCQVLVAKNNKIVFNKAYGLTAGEGSAPVTLETFYDLASVTKVSASTVSIMKLVDEGKVDINKTIGDYLPWVKGNQKEKITLKDLLLHQAGLYPYIKFYESLLNKEKVLNPALVTNVQDNEHNKMITPNLYLHNNWKDTIEQKILNSAVTMPGKYVYSDNDFIFLGQIVEQVSGMSLNEYATQSFYSPLKMKSTGYLPLQKTSIENIAATEVDNYFRNEVIRGVVHDEGASVMGGIAGHAGLFSNATDLAKMYLMLLNKGNWEGKQYLKSTTVEQYTSYNTENSRRGLGFDKPEKNNSTSKDPYPSLSASPSTFGHTGFTGTCVWADPESNLLYIFLSNRVYPTRDNKAFSSLNLRPNIQEVIYSVYKN
ncbi:MAG: serine hydrolase, partial [Sediminibacterium sp.]